MYNLKRIGFAVLGALAGAAVLLGAGLGIFLLERYVFALLTPWQAVVAIIGIVGALIGGSAALDIHDREND